MFSNICKAYSAFDERASGISGLSWIAVRPYLMEPRASFVLLGKFKLLSTKNSKEKVCVRASNVPTSVATLICFVKRLKESPAASTSPLNMTRMQFVFVGLSNESVTVPDK
jgi:hypothetical protein